MMNYLSKILLSSSIALVGCVDGADLDNIYGGTNVVIDIGADLFDGDAVNISASTEVFDRVGHDYWLTLVVETAEPNSCSQHCALEDDFDDCMEYQVCAYPAWGAVYANESQTPVDENNIASGEWSIEVARQGLYRYTVKLYDAENFITEARVVRAVRPGCENNDDRCDRWDVLGGVPKHYNFNSMKVCSNEPTSKTDCREVEVLSANTEYYALARISKVTSLPTLSLGLSKNGDLATNHFFPVPEGTPDLPEDAEQGTVLSGWKDAWMWAAFSIDEAGEYKIVPRIYESEAEGQPTLFEFDHVADVTVE
jgi:hypothetical protein